MFEYESVADADFHRTVKSLIKDNNGCYKSVKQANFLYKSFKERRDPDSVETVKNLFGIDIVDGQRVLMICGYTKWADYGSDSYRPVRWIYVYDKAGIVGEYKLGYVGTMRKGTHPDPEKTKKLWTRLGECVDMVESSTPKVVEDSKSEFIGFMGKRVEVEGVIKSCITFERTRFSYYDTGIGYLTKILVGDNVIVYWGKLDADIGSKVKIRATIKDHDIRDGVKQTIISRPKLI